MQITRTCVLHILLRAPMLCPFNTLPLFSLAPLAAFSQLSSVRYIPSSALVKLHASVVLPIPMLPKIETAAEDIFPSVNAVRESALISVSVSMPLVEKCETFWSPEMPTAPRISMKSYVSVEPKK